MVGTKSKWLWTIQIPNLFGILAPTVVKWFLHFPFLQEHKILNKKKGAAANVESESDDASEEDEDEMDLFDSRLVDQKKEEKAMYTDYFNDQPEEVNYLPNWTRL